MRAAAAPMSSVAALNLNEPRSASVTYSKARALTQADAFGRAAHHP
jgi:hypothetical protein